MRNSKGQAAEWELRKILEQRGEYVIRSAASHKVDLISVPFHGGPYAIEVKSTSKDRFYIHQNAETMAQLTEHLLLSERMPVWYYVRFAYDHAVSWRKWEVKEGFPFILRREEGEPV